MRNWDRLVEEYLEQYAARGIAAETQQNVRRELDRLGCWLKSRRPKPKLEEVGSDLLIDYLKRRAAYKAKATVAGAMSTIRNFGEFLLHQGLWSSNPLRWMRGPKLNPFHRLPRRIGSGALQQLFEQAAKSRQGYHRQMWLTVLALLYGTGLRRGELHRLNVQDFTLGEGLLKIDGRKTGRQRQVVLPDLAVRCLEAYLPKRHNHLQELGIDQEPALLVDKHGSRLSASAISRAVARLGQRCGLPKLTLHQFRHSCASDLLESGVQLPHVQQVLGHQTISTTMRYLHIADPHRHEAVKRHPINEILSSTAHTPRTGDASCQ